MNFDDYQNKTKKYNLLKKVDILGSFDFYTYIISLESLTEKHISELRKVGQTRDLTIEQYELLVKILPLAVHEYTHFIDTCSTLWGLRHLKLMNDAYQSEASGKEEMFINAKKFYDYSRCIRLPDYYTLVDSLAENTRPWESAITIGRIFNANGEISSRSVLFSRFTNSKNEFLVRSPISTVSILEASAMAQELITHISLVSSLREDNRIVEQSNFSKKTIDYLYNSQITEYSVCVHILANKLQCKDVFSAFKLCAILTRLVLNFPLSALKTVADKSPIADILKIDKGHDFEKAVIDGLNNGDLGVLFYLLCQVLPDGSHETKAAAHLVVQEAIKSLGLDYKVLEDEAREEAKLLFSEISMSEIPSIALISKAGYTNFGKIGLNQEKLSFKDLNVPPAILGDSTEFSIGSPHDNSLSGIDLEKLFNELYRGQSWVERFSEACVQII